jgi:hypothetical protein
MTWVAPLIRPHVASQEVCQPRVLGFAANYAECSVCQAGAAGHFVPVVISRRAKWSGIELDGSHNALAGATIEPWHVTC